MVWKNGDIFTAESANQIAALAEQATALSQNAQAAAIAATGILAGIGDAPTARTTLGLGTLATQAANAVAITGGTASLSRVNSEATGAQLQINMGGGTDSRDKSWLWGRMRWFGTVTAPDTVGGETSPNKIIFTDAAIKGGTVDQICAFHVQHILSGNTNTTAGDAGRQAIHAKVNVSGQYGNQGYSAFVGVLTTVFCSANQGGDGVWTPGTPTGDHYRGGAFGYNGNVLLTSGATNWKSIQGIELGAGINTGASAHRRAGASLAATGDQPAVADDAGLMLTATPDASAGRFKMGIQFSATFLGNPVRDDGTLIGAVARNIDASLPLVAQHGVDLRPYALSGMAFASTGFAVTGTGAMRFRPDAVAAPADNGDVVFEATSDTVLTIRRRSGGVNRSVALTLA